MIEDSEMETGRQRNTLSGLVFSLLFLALILAGVLGLAIYKSRGLNYTIKFKDAKGLEVGHKVRLSGITIGQVREIRMDDEDDIAVKVSIDEEYREMVKAGSTAVITSESFPDLSNQKIVKIINPADKNAAPMADGEEIIGQSGIVAAKAWEISSELENAGEKLSGKSRATLESMKIMLEELKDIPESPEVKVAIEKIGQLTQELSEKGIEGLDTLKEKGEQWSEKLAPIMEDLKEAGKEKAADAYLATKKLIDEQLTKMKSSKSDSDAE